MVPRGAALLLLAVLGAVRAGAEEPSRFEVTTGVHRRLTFLKRGVRFFDVYPGSNPGHGERHELHAQGPDGSATRLLTAADLAAFVGEIRAPEEALAYVRFMSDPPASLDHPIEPFSDVGYRELREKILLDPSTTLSIDPRVLKKRLIKPPKVRARLRGGKPFYEITRHVLPDDVIQALLKTLREGGGKPVVKEVGLAVERVEASGALERNVTRVPVEPFPVTIRTQGLD